MALMRQCAGTICGGAVAPPRPGAAGAAGAAPPRPGCTNGPAAFISAATIVVFGSESDLSASQDAGDEASVAESASTANMVRLLKTRNEKRKTRFTFNVFRLSFYVI